MPQSKWKINKKLKKKNRLDYLYRGKGETLEGIVSKASKHMN